MADSIVNLPGEVWKPIPGTDGLYDVSDRGRVRSWCRKGNHHVKRAVAPKLLKQSRLRGYRTVSLPIKGGHRHISVHRLVMLAFAGECPRGREVAHLNGVGSDNQLSNLRYATHKENEADKHAHGTSSVGEGNSNAVLKEWMIPIIRELCKRGIEHRRIAHCFGTTIGAIGTVSSGRSWAHVAPASMPS